MTRPSSPTTVVGAISAAATAGALVAIGHRARDTGGAFATIAAVFTRRATGPVFVGVVLHTVLVFVWSAICVRLAKRFRSQVLGALVVGVANFFVSSLVAAWAGRGLASELTLGDRVVYAVVLTVSLIVGMRYAFLHPRETATS
jgi:hypothetical protein